MSATTQFPNKSHSKVWGVQTSACNFFQGWHNSTHNRIVERIKKCNMCITFFIESPLQNVQHRKLFLLWYFSKPSFTKDLSLSRPDHLSYTSPTSSKLPRMCSAGGLWKLWGSVYTMPIYGPTIAAYVWLYTCVFWKLCYRKTSLLQNLNPLKRTGRITLA